VEGSPDVLAALPPAHPATGAPHRLWISPRFQELSVPTAEVYSVLFRPVAAGPAKARFAPELVAYHRPDHAVSRQYQALADALTGPLSAGTAPVLLFTAAGPGVGATTVVLNLALTLARRDEQRVVVVDAQRDRPAVAERLGLPAVPGLGEVLAGTVSVMQALQDTRQERLAVLTAGRGKAGARWTADALRRLMRQLRDQEALVLVDAPRWDSGPEAGRLAALGDAVYLISADGDDAATADLVRTLPEDGVPLRGQILTGR
jgi:Mrp family chromosome partitioning ATPase